MNRKKTGKLIKKLREEKSISQEELAKLLGVTVKDIEKIENGKSKLIDNCYLNKNRIGVFIKNIREKKNWTQEQLAEKSKLSLRTIKKIELGKYKTTEKTISDLSVLSKTLKIPHHQIINGCCGNSERDLENAKIILLSEKDRLKRKNKITNILLIISSIICILGIIWIHENHDFTYLLEGESKNFKYNNGMFIHDSGTYLFMFGSFEFKNENITEDDIVYVSLKCDDRLIIGSSYFLSGATRENKGYDELFPKEVAKNIDDWYYEITYKINEEIVTEKLEIENESI